MHNHKIIQKIIEEAKRQGAEGKIVLEVGEISEFEGGEIAQEVEEHSGWDVEIISKESKIECSCGYSGRARILDRGHGYCIFDCPVCGNKKVKILEGAEIKLMGVE